MPAFQKIDKNILVKNFAKYIKKNKIVSTISCLDFFVEFGMRPNSDVCTELFKLGHKKAIAYNFIKWPEIVTIESLKGVCFFNTETKIAYFTEISDVVIIKLLEEKEVTEIIK
jgi:hypothetical protein